MSTINFDQLFESLKNGVESVAKDSFQDYYSQAKADGQSALKSLKGNLQQWTLEVENGDMSTDDLVFLLKGEEALNEMIALKQAGLASVHIDQFKNGLVNMIISTLTGFVKV